MDNIKIIKLHNGEDIVGTVINSGNGHYTITEPMSFGVNFRNNEAGLIMKHWLPVQLLKKNEVELCEKDILSFIDPADDFAEYYVNTVGKIKDLLKAKNLVNELSDEEIDDIMEAFEELKQHGDTLH